MAHVGVVALLSVVASALVVAFVVRWDASTGAWRGLLAMRHLGAGDLLADASRDFDLEQASALAAHLLDQREAHHVCVTGNMAAKAMDLFLLKVANARRIAWKMPSLISQDTCEVEEARVGSTLFTIASRVADACAARWHAQSRTCDVLMHAHSTDDCTELFKARLYADKCVADLLILHEDPALRTCMEAKMADLDAQVEGFFHAECRDGMRWIQLGNGNAAAQVTHVFKKALLRVDGSAPVVLSAGEGETTVGLRRRLQEAYASRKSSVVNLREELVAALQGLPVNSYVKEMLKSVGGRRLMQIDHNALVCDNGSGNIKAGYSGEDKPTANFPSVIGVDAVAGSKELVGEEATDKMAQGTTTIQLRFPLERGILKNVDDMEKLWRHMYSKLQIGPDEHPILMTVTPLTPHAHKKQIADLLFNKLKVPKLYLESQASLSMFSSGRITGITVDIGAGVTCLTPAYEGFLLHAGIICHPCGGRDLTMYMQRLLQERGFDINFQCANAIKKSYAYVLKFAQRGLAENDEVEDSDQTTYECDGKTIPLRRELFMVPEALFRPYLLRLEGGGLHERIMDAISKLDVDVRKRMYDNILLTGGSSQFPKLAERLKEEIRAAGRQRVQVIEKQEPSLSAWLGGSITTALPSFGDMWITPKEYTANAENMFNNYW